MKNKEIERVLLGIQTLSTLKLGGLKSKAILKNKKALITAYEELMEVKKKLVSDYKDDGSEDGKETFSEENMKIINKEWVDVNECESGVIMSYLNSAEIDQMSDLTLEQAEALMLMCE